MIIMLFEWRTIYKSRFWKYQKHKITGCQRVMPRYTSVHPFARPKPNHGWAFRGEKLPVVMICNCNPLYERSCTPVRGRTEI